MAKKPPFVTCKTQIYFNERILFFNQFCGTPRLFKGKFAKPQNNLKVVVPPQDYLNYPNFLFKSN